MISAPKSNNPIITLKALATITAPAEISLAIPTNLEYLLLKTVP